jgi:fringe
MLPVAGNGKFLAIGDKIRFPDDVTMGFIIGELLTIVLFDQKNHPKNFCSTEHILNRPLSVVDAFHSHLEQLEIIQPDTFQDQVSFSYSKTRNIWNVVKLDGGLDVRTDPKRFYSLHCHLFPHFSFCPR